MIERYWLFAAICVVAGVVVLRLVFRERLTLQSSLAYLGFLGGLGVGFWKDTRAISEAWAQDRAFVPQMEEATRRSHLDRWASAVQRA